LKTVFELIEDHGLTLHGDIEHFAALVIANHPPQSYMTWQEGYEAGKQAERERLQAFMRQMIDAYTLSSNPGGLKTRGETK
jgi:dihydrodipicolinate synthase/N-acetylneuraminate lyase